ncbi:cyclic nucleotide-binding domain-containing protein [Legionella sp. 27cVA30]|uniref:cyclic nucleotide-binding domain-containing protein n=1 Tax=Legionella sp. 27cVA30 TaxID=2905657 RepID=UPI00209F59CC|nr:cyclic nucleotide-binding domain-containing protein [Legionella sp. 27cVA30]MCP0913467.1 cyclic nucleotide-binding domain-containing protein [Legionella sp. 27cVA30]
MKAWFSKLIPKVLLGDRDLQKNFFLSLILSTFPAAFSLGATVFSYSVFLSTYPTSWIPYWMLGEAITIFLLGNLFSLYTPKNLKKYVQASFLAIGFILILVLFLNQASWYWAPFTSILLFRACASILAAIMWSFISTLFYYRQFKAIFNRFTVTASLSSIMTPLLYAGITSFLPISLLPLVFILFLVMAFFISDFTVRIVASDASEQDKNKISSRSPLHYPLFRTLVLLIVLFTTIFQIAEFLFRTQLDLNFNKEEIGTFVALFLSVCNTISLGTQLLASMVFARIKFSNVLQFILSLILVMGTIYWLYPSLWLIAVLNGLGVIFSYGWLTMIFKNIVNVFPPVIIIKGEIFVKSYCGPISVIIAAFFALISTHSTLFINYLPLLFIVFSLLGILLSIELFKRYSMTLKEMVMTSGFSVITRDEKEREYIQNLVLTTLDKPSVGPLEIALITPKLFATPPSLLYQILSDNRKKEIQDVVIHVLDQYPSDSLNANKLIDLYRHAELNLKARELLYKLLSDVHSDILIKDAKARLKENPTAKNALLMLLKNGDVKDYLFAIDLMIDLVKSPQTKHRVIAAKLLHALGPGRLYDLKGKLLTDKEPLVRLTAFHNLPAQDVLDMLPALGKFLNRNTIKILHQRFEMKKLLPLAKQLMTLYYKNPHEYRESAQAFIVPLPHQSVEPFIIEFLKEKNIYLRTIIAMQLLERKLKVTFSKPLVNSLLDALHFETSLIQQYKLLLSLDSLQSVKPLLHNRIYYAKQRFLYWYASYHENTVNISASIAKINPYYVTRANKNIQDKAIEYLIANENKLILRKLIEAAFTDASHLKQEPKTEDWEAIFIDDPWLMQCLSKYLIGVATEMNPLQRTIALQQTDFFESLPDEVLFELGQSCELLDCAPEQVIITEGEEGDSLYVLVQGEVLIYKNNELLASLKPFKCFGEMAFFGGNKRTSTVIAKDRALLLVLDKEHFFTITNEFPQILHNITQIISQRFQAQIAMLENKIKTLDENELPKLD